MRILQKTISVLLTAQLMISFGLYGGLCCLKSAKLSALHQVEQTAEPEKNLPPCHRKKAAEKAPPHQTHHTQPTPQTSIPKVAAPVANQNCCFLKREIPAGELTTISATPQVIKLVTVVQASPWHDGEVATELPQIPIHVFSTHSPPHTGFQLSLRI